MTGHSFRGGGASFLKILGFSDEFIKLKGRWTSMTYKEYINTRVNFSLQKKRLVIKGKTKFKQMLDKLEEEQGSPECPVSSKGELQSVGSLGKDSHPRVNLNHTISVNPENALNASPECASEGEPELERGNAVRENWLETSALYLPEPLGEKEVSAPDFQEEILKLPSPFQSNLQELAISTSVASECGVNPQVCEAATTFVKNFDGKKDNSNVVTGESLIDLTNPAITIEGIESGEKGLINLDLSNAFGQPPGCAIDAPVNSEATTNEGNKLLWPYRPNLQGNTLVQNLPGDDHPWLVTYI